VKRELVLAGIAIFAICAFSLVPVIFTTTYWPCGDACQYEAPHHTFLPAYESLSCAVLGLGDGYSTSGAYGPGKTSLMLSCPPKIIHIPIGNSGG